MLEHLFLFHTPCIWSTDTQKHIRHPGSPRRCPNIFKNPDELQRVNAPGSSWTQLWVEESILWQIQPPCTYKMNILNKLRGYQSSWETVQQLCYLGRSGFALHCTWHYCSIGKLIINSFHHQKQNSRMRNKNRGLRVTVDKMKPNKLVAGLPFLDLFQKAGVLVIYTVLKWNKMYALKYMSLSVAWFICHPCYINPSIINNRKIISLKNIIKPIRRNFHHICQRTY